MAVKQDFTRESEEITVVEKREVLSVTVDAQTGMTDAIEQVQIVKADGTVLSTQKIRKSAPTVEVVNWISEAQAKSIANQPAPAPEVE